MSKVLHYAIQDPIELNLSYMPFIQGGGIFVPTADSFLLGEKAIVELLLPGRVETLHIEGTVVWLTPKNALHHVLSGVGIQFAETCALQVRTQIENLLDKTMEVGGYTYGITDGKK